MGVSSILRRYLPLSGSAIALWAWRNRDDVIDWAAFGVRSAQGLVTASIRGLRRGRHTLKLSVSDYQESKNMENVRRILPNTRRLSTAFVVR